MFKNLTNFGYQRTWLEAIGFYLAYFLLLILFSALVGGIAGAIVGTAEQAAAVGGIIGNIIAIIASIALPLLILSQKKLLNNFGYILLVLLAGTLSLFLGGLFGLIPAAFLTTRKSAGKATAVKTAKPKAVKKTTKK